MKKRVILAVVSAVFLIVSGCRDAKSEAEANEKALTKIDSIESDLEETQQKLDATSKALSEAIAELDSL